MLPVKASISQEWCEGRTYGTCEGLAQYAICSLFHLCIPWNAWYFTLHMKWTKINMYVIHVVLQSHISPASLRKDTQYKMMWKWKNKTKLFQDTKRLGGRRVPLLFLLSHRTSGRRSEGMYKQNKESAKDPGDRGDPEEGITQGLWTSRLWAPSCSFTLPQPITSALEGQKRGRGS